MFRLRNFQKKKGNFGKNSMILKLWNYKVLTQNQFVTSKRFTFKIIFEPQFEITFFFDKYEILQGAMTKQKFKMKK